MTNQFALMALLATAAGEATSALWAFAHDVPPFTTPEEVAERAGVPIDMAREAFKNADAELELRIGADIEKMVTQIIGEAKTEAETEVEVERVNIKEIFDKWTAEFAEIVKKGRESDPSTVSFYDNVEKLQAKLQRDVREARLKGHVAKLYMIFHSRCVGGETARKIAELLAYRD